MCLYIAAERSTYTTYSTSKSQYGHMENVNNVKIMKEESFNLEENN